MKAGTRSFEHPVDDEFLGAIFYGLLCEPRDANLHT